MIRFRSQTRLAILLVLLTGSATVFGGCSSYDSVDSLDITNPELVQAAPGQRSFSATLVNRQDRPIRFAAVTVAFYDGTGHKVETARIGVEEVPARGSVEFHGTIDSDKPFKRAHVQSVLSP